MTRTNLKLLLYKPETTKIIIILAAIALVWFTTPHTALAQTPTSGNTATATGGDDLLDKLGVIAKDIVMFLIGLSGLILAVSVALGGFSAQYASLMGVPYAQASAGMKVATAVLLFSLTAGSMWLANTVIDTIGGLVNTGGSIHIIR